MEEDEEVNALMQAVMSEDVTPGVERNPHGSVGVKGNGKASEVSDTYDESGEAKENGIAGAGVGVQKNNLITGGKLVPQSGLLVNNNNVHHNRNNSNMKVEMDEALIAAASAADCSDNNGAYSKIEMKNGMVGTLLGEGKEGSFLKFQDDVVAGLDEDEKEKNDVLSKNTAANAGSVGELANGKNTSSSENTAGVEKSTSKSLLKKTQKGTANSCPKSPKKVRFDVPDNAPGDRPKMPPKRVTNTRLMGGGGDRPKGLHPFELLSLFKKACEVSKMAPIQRVVEQLEKADDEGAPYTCLELNGAKLDGKKGEPILKLIMNCGALEVLKLVNCGITDKVMHDVCQAVLKKRTVMHLDLSENRKIKAAGMRHVSTILNIQKTLVSLNLSGIEMDKKRLDQLKCGFRNTRIEILVMKECNLKKPALVEVFCGAIKLCRSLKTAHLSMNKITSVGAKHFADLISANGSSLCHLDLRNNNIQDIGAMYIADSLCKNKTLEILNLSNNSISGNGIKALGIALTSNRHLRTLNLSYNNMFKYLEPFIDFKNCLIINKAIKHLNLAHTGMESEGAVAFAEALAENRSLEWVDLKGNDCKTAGLMAFTRALKMNTTMLNFEVDEPEVKCTEMDRSLLDEILIYLDRNDSVVRSNELVPATISNDEGADGAGDSDSETGSDGGDYLAGDASRGLDEFDPEYIRGNVSLLREVLSFVDPKANDLKNNDVAQQLYQVLAACKLKLQDHINGNEDVAQLNEYLPLNDDLVDAMDMYERLLDSDNSEPKGVEVSS
eukprot:Nk52_evm6s291 gene=Nk52_evmTU6s291